MGRAPRSGYGSALSGACVRPRTRVTDVTTGMLLQRIRGRSFPCSGNILEHAHVSRLHSIFTNSSSVEPAVLRQSGRRPKIFEGPVQEREENMRECHRVREGITVPPSDSGSNSPEIRDGIPRCVARVGIPNDGDLTPAGHVNSELRCHSRISVYPAYVWPRLRSTDRLRVRHACQDSFPHPHRTTAPVFDVFCGVHIALFQRLNCHACTRMAQVWACSAPSITDTRTGRVCRSNTS